ncbi:hypothetical protein FBX97_5601 [Herbaspirillum sp. SJZ107]|nr:hypothetical protein FBX97_5601 [Herbaspirillum sp. SJZ107]
MQPQQSPRCGAKTRSGMPCRTATVRGKKRCRMHGGNSPGAPRGNQNALKSGAYTSAAKAQRRDARVVLKRLRELIAEIEKLV